MAVFIPSNNKKLAETTLEYHKTRGLSPIKSRKYTGPKQNNPTTGKHHPKNLETGYLSKILVEFLMDAFTVVLLHSSNHPDING